MLTESARLSRQRVQTYATGEWTWISGSNVAGASSVYGTQGMAAASNMPGARENAACQVDAAGNVWLFGGDDGNANGMPFLLNDFWKYDSVTGLWTWIGGSQSTDAKGVYGTQGRAASADAPGARDNPVAWIDASGQLWLFGGLGEDSTGLFGDLNDLWQYSPSANAWTWLGGSNVADRSGAYGTLGTAGANNAPGGGRSSSASAVDSSGHLWLFGGFGFDSTGNPGQLNDLWTL
jgi:N-acetylneuraminic acid mutarotase